MRPTRAIFTALDIEREAAESVLDTKRKDRRAEKLGYTLGTIRNIQGQTHNILIATTEAGKVETATILAHVLEHYPDIASIIMTGIAGGLPTEKKPQKIGDIVATGLNGFLDYEQGKATSGDFEPRPLIYQPDLLLLRAAKTLQKAGEPFPWLEEIEKGANNLRKHGKRVDLWLPEGIKPQDAELHIGRIATGDKVVADPAFHEMIRKTGAIAVEMESSGITRALYRRQEWDPKQRTAFGVRGISDLADVQKADHLQRFTALSAAAVTRSLLKRVPIIEPEKRATVQVPEQIQKEKFWNVPFDRHPSFIGREDDVADIKQRLQTDKIVVLTGMAGIGKTQTAVEFAHQNREKYQNVLWLEAESEAKLIAGIREVAAQLNISIDSSAKKEEIIGQLKKWLAKNKNYLVILDNIEDPLLIEDLLPAEKERNGHIIATSRDPIGLPSAPASTKNLYILDENKGGYFLLKSIGAVKSEKEYDPESAIALAAETISLELGGIPLALHQAAAYIRETRRSVPEYLELLRGKKAQLLRTKGRLHPRDYPDTMEAAILTSINQMSPAGQKLLKLCSFYDPDGIGIGFFTFDKVLADSMVLDGAIADGIRFGFLQRHGQFVVIHRLVQAVIQEQMNETESLEYLQEAIENFSKIIFEFKFLPGSTVSVGIFLNLLRLCKNITQFGLVSDEAQALFVETSRGFVQLRALEKAKEYLQLALRINEDIENIVTLGVVLYEQAKIALLEEEYGKAKSLMQEALTKLELFGKEMDTLKGNITMNLGLAFYLEGNPNEAIRVYEEYRSRYGQDPNLPKTARVNWLCSMAEAVVDTGDIPKAQELLNETLDYYFSLDFKEVAVSKLIHGVAVEERIVQLIHVVSEKGKTSDDETNFLRSLEKTYEVCLNRAKEHSGVLPLMRKLRYIYGQKGDLKEAEKIARELVEVDEKLFPPGNMVTLEDMLMLGKTLAHQERFGEAEKITKRTYEIADRHNSPYAEMALASLGVIMQGQSRILRSDSAKSIDRLRRAEKIFIEAIGRLKGKPLPDDAQLFLTLHDLASTILERSELEEIPESEYDRAIDAWKEALNYLGTPSSQKDKIFYLKQSNFFFAIQQDILLLLKKGKREIAQRLYEQTIKANLEAGEGRAIPFDEYLKLERVHFRAGKIEGELTPEP